MQRLSSIYDHNEYIAEMQAAERRYFGRKEWFRAHRPRKNMKRSDWSVSDGRNPIKKEGETWGLRDDEAGP